LPEGRQVLVHRVGRVERRQSRLVDGESCRTVLLPDFATALFPDFGLAMPVCSAPFVAQLRFGNTLAVSGTAGPLPAVAARVSCPPILGYLGLAGAVDLNVVSRPALVPAEPLSIGTIVPALA
ncbi:MAG TPA: hypothetical protein VH298_07645, partial [Jatrophihabitans sp.]|nr:hypothetical protein [Jatrophihabitans sp.]